MDRNEEKTGRVQLTFTDKVQPVEQTAELTLPDYRSEISRLLWVRPTLLPPAKFVGGGKLELSGPIRYRILYVGPDGALYGAECEEGYAFSVPLEPMNGFEGESGEFAVELMPDAVISRVTGPRKLSVRCRMRVGVKGYADKSISPVTRQTGGENSEIYRLCEAAENGRLWVGDVMDTEIGERLDVEREEGELRLVSADGALLVQDAVAGDNAVACRGEAVLRLLLCREGSDAAPFVITRRLAFSEELPLEGVTPDHRVRVTGQVGEIRADLEENGIDLSARMYLQAEGMGEEPVIYCKDMYRPGHHAACKHTEVRLWQPAVCQNRSFSVAGECSLQGAGMPGDGVILHSVADGEIKSREVQGGRTLLSGEVHCHTLYRRGEEYGVAELTLPFRTVLEETCDDISVNCTLPLCKVTLQGDMLRMDGEVCLSLRGCAYDPTRMLSEVGFTEAEPMPRGDMEICYPATEDTLWEVGKRYGVSPDALAAANGISADAPGGRDSLQGVKYLLVP